MPAVPGLAPLGERRRRWWRMPEAVKPESCAEGIRIRFRWGHAYSLTLRFGLPGNRASTVRDRRSRKAARIDGQRSPLKRGTTVGDRRVIRRHCGTGAGD